MEKLNRNLVIIGGTILVSLIFLIGIVYKQESLGLASNQFIPYAQDVIGTKSGTTTTFVGFGVTGNNNHTATTSYVTKTGGEIDEAIYTFQAKASSSATVAFALFGSNDDYCNTATTSTVLDKVTTGDIFWVNLAEHYRGKVHGTSISTATSSLAWNTSGYNAGKAGTEIVLTDLGFECLRLDVSGSSTELRAQIKTK